MLKMKRIYHLMIACALAAAVSACGGSKLNDKEAKYDKATADELVALVTRGDKLEQGDYSRMIEQTRAGLIEMNRTMDSAKVETKAQRDSVLRADGSGKSALGQMIDNCTVMERVLRNANLDKDNREAYNELMKLEKEYMSKFKE